jgi:UrcA family protein
MSAFTKYTLAAVVAVVMTVWQAAALAASLSGAAAAPATQSVVVRYADLDLNRPQDVKVLYGRIQGAAGHACGEEYLTGSILPLPSWQQCVVRAVDEAVARLDRPTLSAYHREHTTDASRKG